MKYLVIGASGFIGSAVYDYCVREGLGVYGTCHSQKKRSEFVSFDQTRDVLESIFLFGSKVESKDVAVILCSANTSIDSCKKNEEVSRLLNVKSTERLIDEVLDVGALPVFISSEAVFDGKRGLYSEDDCVNPITVYGSQKVEVEQYLKCATDNYLLFRVSRAVSSIPKRGDIFDEFSDKIQKGEEIICLKDQSFNPTDVNDVAKCIVDSCEARLRGVYHIANRDYVTRAELARIYAERMHKKVRVIEKEYDEMAFVDNRHVYGGLNAQKIENELDYSFVEVDEIVSRLVWINGRESKQ